MAGGEGTRLRPLTSNQPKPMVPIVGKPCMEHILDLLRRHEMDEVVVTLAFMPQAIRTYFGDGESLGVDIDYSVEEQPLGTAGSVRARTGAARRDVPRDLGRRALRRRPRLSSSRRTGRRARPSRSGSSRSTTRSSSGSSSPTTTGASSASSRSRPGARCSRTRSTPGSTSSSPRCSVTSPTTGPYDFSKELFPLLLEMGRPMYGHVLDGYWQDIGNLDQFRQANFDALDGHVELEVPGLRLRGNVWVSEEVDINQVEPVEGPAFIGANCRISDGASIGPYSVLSQGVIVREGARVTRSVIDVGDVPRAQLVVEGAILGRSLRPSRPRPGARRGRDRRPGDDRARRQASSRASACTRSRRSRPAPRSTRASSGRRAPRARRSDGTARPGSSTSTSRPRRPSASRRRSARRCAAATGSSRAATRRTRAA